MDWNEYFIKIANQVRLKSKDPSSKIGAVIVSKNNEILSTGYNGFCRGVQENHFSSSLFSKQNIEVLISERWERPTKYLYVEHAERNAIYNAARNGIKLLDSKIYIVGFGPPTLPCVDCAKGIIQSGIKEIYGYAIKEARENWAKDFDFTYQMLQEAGIKFTDLSSSNWIPNEN